MSERLLDPLFPAGTVKERAFRMLLDIGVPSRKVFAIQFANNCLLCGTGTHAELN